jgi:hypothetical protein
MREERARALGYIPFFDLLLLSVSPFFCSEPTSGERGRRNKDTKEDETLRTPKNYIAHKTLKARHRLIKWLSPHIAYSLDQLQIMHNYITKTPRPMILFAKKHFAERRVQKGIEIGVAAGDNALSILNELAVDKLFLVDPYVPYEFDGRI